MFKTRLRTFGNDFGQLWNFEIFSIFWKHFENSTLHGTLGKKIFSKKLPQNMFKTLLDNLGTILGIFGILKIFNFLKTFRRLDPPWNTGQNNFRKNYLKTCSKHVWTLLRTILGIFGISKIFDFMKTFRRLDPPWNTGQIKFPKKLPQNMFKTRLDTFGNDFGHFWNFWNIFDFLKTFRRLDPPWNTGQKNFFENINP